MAREHEIAVYEHGSFVPAWTPSHAERLLRSPRAFAVRLCRIGNLRRDVFNRLATMLSAPSGREPSLLDVVRGLVRFVTALPQYARLTGTISTPARNVRDALVRAREPATLLFDDLPAACECERFGAGGETDRNRINVFVGRLKDALREIQDAYPDLLTRCRSVMARQLDLPDAPNAFTAELTKRARRLREIAVDPALKSFVLRASDSALEPNDLMVSLLTQLANKPPAEWADADDDQFQVGLTQVARRFRSMEALVVDMADNGDDEQLVRLAVTRRGHAERERVLPLRPEEKRQIEKVRKRVRTALGDDDPPDRVLAALALIAEDLLEVYNNRSQERRKP